MLIAPKRLKIRTSNLAGVFPGIVPTCPSQMFPKSGRTIPFAPDCLLKYISCRCKRSGCTSGRCSCREHNLLCTELCSCEGCGNSNSAEQDIEETDVASDDEADEEMSWFYMYSGRCCSCRLFYIPFSLALLMWQCQCMPGLENGSEKNLGFLGF